MKNILTKLLKFSKISIPAKVRASFLEKFGDSLNVEWMHMDESYEAIFYLDGNEHIAHFDMIGKLINLKKNLPLYTAPGFIIQKAALHGELMNIIEIREEEIVGYELIVRDQSMIRFSILLNEKGGLIQKHKL